MNYFDTSYILKCYITEPGSAEARRPLEKDGGAACCSFGRLELSAAVRRCVREGRLDRRAAPTVFQVLRQDDEDGVWLWLALTPQLIELATTLVQSLPEGVFIRAADALHLAAAQEHGCTTLYTNDRHLLAAAPHFGVVASNVIP